MESEAKSVVEKKVKLQELYKLVETQSKEFDKYENVEDGQTWKYHIVPVIKNSIMLAKKYRGDVEVVEIAALFHDYANLVDFEKYSEVHHIASGELAEPILHRYGYEQSFIDKVKKCIFSHRASVVKDKLSTEEICLADADGLTHIQNVFEIIIWRGQKGDSVEAANAFVKKKIQKTYAKLSEESKLYIKDKYEAILEILY